MSNKIDPFEYFEESELMELLTDEEKAIGRDMDEEKLQTYVRKLIVRKILDDAYEDGLIDITVGEDGELEYSATEKLHNTQMCNEFD